MRRRQVPDRRDDAGRHTPYFTAAAAAAIGTEGRIARAARREGYLEAGSFGRSSLLLLISRTPRPDNRAIRSFGGRPGCSACPCFPRRPVMKTTALLPAHVSLFGSPRFNLRREPRSGAGSVPGGSPQPHRQPAAVRRQPLAGRRRRRSWPTDKVLEPGSGRLCRRRRQAADADRRSVLDRLACPSRSPPPR